MRDSDKLRGPNNGLPVEPEQGEPPYIDHHADLVTDEKQPADWSDQSMWEKASKAGPARPNPLFEPTTETISLSPAQAQRCLAAQLAANMLKTDGKPFMPGHYPSANEVMTLAEWIIADAELTKAEAADA